MKDSHICWGVFMLLSIAECVQTESFFTCYDGYKLTSCHRHLKTRFLVTCGRSCQEEDTCQMFSFDERTGDCCQTSDNVPLLIEAPENSSHCFLGNVSHKNIPTDCTSLAEMNPSSRSGYYLIRPTVGVAVQVYCDMSTDGGGWIVFQRRQDGSENFYRNWEDYQNGFGRLDGEFWLGNDAIHRITNVSSYELRVDLEDFEGNSAYALYSHFSVGGSDNFYQVSVGHYSGTAGDALGSRNGQMFSTFDSDNDEQSTHNCAVKYTGAWWYKSCHPANLNGQYLQGKHTSLGDGVNWSTYKGQYYSLKFTEMKIRQAQLSIQPVDQINKDLSPY